MRKVTRTPLTVASKSSTATMVDKLKARFSYAPGEFALQVPIQPGTKTFIITRWLATLGMGQLSPTMSYQSNIAPTAEQSGNFSQDLSDHLKAFFTPPSDSILEKKRVIWNVMMRARSATPGGRSANTAFGHTETREEYMQRLQRILEDLKQVLLDNPDIAIIGLQEAPIKEDLAYFKAYVNEHFPEDWKLDSPNVLLDSTPWGVLTIINTQHLSTQNQSSLYLVQDDALTENIPIQDIGIRCRTFSMRKKESSIEGKTTELEKITNLHLPHAKTEEAFIAYMTNVVHEVFEKGLNKECFNHSLVGDWNIQTERLKELLDDIIETEKAKLAQKELPIALSATLVPSPEGHLKQSGEKLSVDHQLTLTVKPSEKFEYQFKVNAKKLIRKGSFVVGVGLVGGTAFNRVSKDNSSEEESHDDKPKPSF